MTQSAENPRADPSRWLHAPVESGARAGFGLYLHVPFCAHRCGYCDFATTAVGDGDEQLYDRYVAALHADLAHQVARTAGWVDEIPVDGAWPTVTSIFVGGGTPTMLGGARLAQLLQSVRSLLDVATDAEITVECNPETASNALFAALAEAGTTRVSLGAQSFVPQVLDTLERRHTAAKPLDAVRLVRAAGIPQVNLDLIYGTPGESAEDWRTSVAMALDAGVDHVSAYALTIHDNTPFGTAVSAGKMANVDDDVQRARFDDARAMFAAAGFDHYEVSNWARDVTKRSRHNVLYWRHGNYLAVGVGAHGHVNGTRWWSTRSTDRYLSQIDAGVSPIAGSETLDADAQALERLLLGLRLREGIHPYDLPPLESEAVERALDSRLVEFSCGRLRASDDGWFLLDSAVQLLLP